MIDSQKNEIPYEISQYKRGTYCTTSRLIRPGSPGSGRTSRPAECKYPFHCGTWTPPRSKLCSLVYGIWKTFFYTRFYWCWCCRAHARRKQIGKISWILMLSVSDSGEFCPKRLSAVNHQSKVNKKPLVEFMRKLIIAKQKTRERYGNGRLVAK